MNFAGQIESQTFLILFMFLSLKISSFLTFWLFLSVKYMFPPLKCFNSSKTVLFSPTKFLIGTSSPRSSRSPFRRLTDTMTVNCYFPYYFLFFLFFHFSPPQPFLIEGVLGSKNLFSESWREHQKLTGTALQGVTIFLASCQRELEIGNFLWECAIYLKISCKNFCSGGEFQLEFKWI